MLNSRATAPSAKSYVSSGSLQIILIFLSEELSQKVFLLEYLPMNGGEAQEDEDEKDQPAIDEKRAQEPKVEEYIDRIAREREEPGGHEWSRRLHIKPYAPGVTE